MSTVPSSSSSSTSASTSLYCPSSSSSSSSGTLRRACAACRYGRHRCTPDCMLAPFFPADEPQRFLNANKLFGSKNILKIIRHLHDPVLRNDAMRSIIYECDARARDPVGGCYRIVQELKRQLAISSAELTDVLRHLAIFRAQASAPAAPSHAMTAIADPDLLPSTSCPIYGGPDHDSLPYLDNPDTISADDYIIDIDCEICVMQPADAPPPPPDASHLGPGLSNVDDDNEESSKG